MQTTNQYKVNTELPQFITGLENLKFSCSNFPSCFSYVHLRVIGRLTFFYSTTLTHSILVHHLVVKYREYVQFLVFFLVPILAAQIQVFHTKQFRFA